MSPGFAPIAVVLLALAAGCGGDERPPDPADAVRAAAAAFVDALRDARWADACDRMTRAARTTVAEGAGSCAGALRAGGALPREDLDTVARQLAGARVRFSDAGATLGPVGDLPQPLRFERRTAAGCSRPERSAGRDDLAGAAEVVPAERLDVAADVGLGERPQQRLEAAALRARRRDLERLAH